MRNPIRRSRKIGQTQGGRVKGGKAREKVSRMFTGGIWEKLSEEGGKWKVVRENPSSEYFHPCTEADYLGVLERLPEELTSSLQAIVLRRTPKRDAALGIEAWKRYRCVVMNAFPKAMVMTWVGHVTLKAMRHYAPWCRTWSNSPDLRYFWLQWSSKELRRYYLYHLFLHELGHINQPDFHASRRREEFAENFALEWARRLGELTMDYDEAYERIVDQWRADGLVE